MGGLQEAIECISMIYTNSEQEETCYVDGKFLDSLKKQLKGYERVYLSTKYQIALPKFVYQNLEKDR